MDSSFVENRVPASSSSSSSLFFHNLVHCILRFDILHFAQNTEKHNDKREAMLDAFKSFRSKDVCESSKCSVKCFVTEWSPKHRRQLRRPSRVVQSNWRHSLQCVAITNLPPHQIGCTTQYRRSECLVRSYKASFQSPGICRRRRGLLVVANVWIWHGCKRESSQCHLRPN
jgi:hypothetical protein